ncbi:peroxisome proliferator-activated receptor gamma coactivator-related protein 1 [Eudromia elegans]
MAALWGGVAAAAAGTGDSGAGAARRGRAGGGAAAEPGPGAGSALQCFSLDEDDLNLASLDAETILEAEEILGTMQNYLDSSVISIIEDLSLSESKGCLDAQNELSLLTAITEILDSTDDETLSPFDTIMDAELLTSPRERENPSFQKFLSLSRPSLERESPALEQPKGLRPLSGGSVSVLGKADTEPLWERAAHSLEEPVLPRKQVCSTPRVERRLGRPRAREQPLPQRSDGEEEEEEAALSPELDSGREAAELGASGAGAALEEREDPCIINTGDVSLSELVKSMHPYCLPTFTVCLDPETEPVAKELLNGPVLLEIVPGEGESMEIPVVLQPLAPDFPGLQPELLGAEQSAEEPVPEDPEGPQGPPVQESQLEEEEEEKSPLEKEARGPAPESKAPPERAAPAAGRPESSDRGSAEALPAGKREASEKGRGRERARKSRKKKPAEAPGERAGPGRDCVAHRLRSAGPARGPGPGQPGSQRRAARPSAQVSDFLAKQLERARKEGQMELRAERAPRPRGRAQGAAAAAPPETQREEAAPGSGGVLAAERAEAVELLEKVAPSPEELQELGEGLPREGRPRALSLREYRLRMLQRPPAPGGPHGHPRAAGKWPSVPEAPAELAEIPCLVAPARPPAEAPSAPKSPETPASAAAVPAPASKAPATLNSTPAALPPPATSMPFTAPNVPPGVAMPPAPTGAYGLYPPVPSWPCFGPQPAGCPGLVPPTATASPGAYHLVPGLPPPTVAWPPPPAVPPPPPFGAGTPYAPVGWAPPSFWPGIPLPPPPGPALAYAEPGAAPPSAAAAATAAFPAVVQGQPPPAPGGTEPPAGTETARPAGSRVCDPRRQARLAGDAPLPKGPVPPGRVPPAAAAQQAAAPPAASVQPPAPASSQLVKAPPAVTAGPAEVSPATTTAATAAGDSPVTRPAMETTAPGTGAPEKALPEPPAAARQEPAAPKGVPVPGAAPLKTLRESSLPARAPPGRHQPLAGPAAPSGSGQDIVRAFISEIGIEAADLSSLLEQFEKSEVKKEEAPAQPPEERRPPANSGSESQQDKKAPDGLQASELANVAGLTPPATPPHQLWKPLPTVSLLAKAPGAAPQDRTQKATKVPRAKQLPQSKAQERSPGSAPSHVCSGDHDYCMPGPARAEGGAQPPPQGGSRWNVKHHRDITIKPIASLAPRTLEQPKAAPPAPAAGEGPSHEPLGKACPAPLDYRTSVPSEATAGGSSPPPSVLLSPAASPCREPEERPPGAQPSRAAAKRSLRCYRRARRSPSPSAGAWRAGRSRASRSFSSSSDGASESSSSSSSSSSSRSRSRSSSPPSKRWRRYRSRCSPSSSSRSSCGSCGRSRDRSSSSSSYSSRSTSRSQSRSPSPRRRSNRRRRYSYEAQDHYQRQRILQKERAIEERRVVFIGKIPSRMTRSELRHRFSVFGDIEECTLHFRSEGDNYGFVTYRYAEEAFAAIESGHKLRRPDEQPFDLCFGGRRQFCRRNYADLDSNREDFDPAPVKSKFDSLDFDTLLRQAQRSLRR